jgi:hypothetical protein
MAERLLLEAMAAVDGSLTRWRAERDGPRDQLAFTATGVRGAYCNILPADAMRDATASVAVDWRNQSLLPQDTCLHHGGPGRRPDLHSPVEHRAWY